MDTAVHAAFTVFPGEVFRAPRSWVERLYNKVVYFHEAHRRKFYVSNSSRDKPDCRMMDKRVPIRSWG